MNRSEFTKLINSDLYRYCGGKTRRDFLRYFLLNPGFKYTYYMRFCCYLSQYPLAKPIYWAARIRLLQCEYKFGITIPPQTNIGSGFYIGHFGNIIVNSKAIIGNNCNISQGVTVGQSNRGIREGVPTIGNNVYIGPGSKIVGRVTIGNNVAIGANCVVTTDIPDNAVVAGIPGKIISFKGSVGYINRTDY